MTSCLVNFSQIVSIRRNIGSTRFFKVSLLILLLLHCEDGDERDSFVSFDQDLEI